MRTTTATAASAYHDIELGTVLVLAMAMPMLLLYAVGALGPRLAQDLAIAPASLGYFTLGSFGVAATLSLWAGALVGRLGVRHGLSALFGSVAIAFALIAVVRNFYGIFLATMLVGLAQALANPVTNLLIARRITPQRKALVVGLKQSGVQLAALFAGLVLPTCAAYLGWRVAFALVAPMALALAVVALRLGADPPLSHENRRKAAMAPNRPLRLLMALQLCVGMALSTFVTYLPTYAVGLGMGQAEAGLLIAFFGGMGVVSRVLMTPLGSRLREEAYLLAGLLLIAAVSIALALLADAASRKLLWGAVIGVGLTAVATNAIAMNILIRDATFGSVASTSGRVSAAFFAGFAIGPVSAGELARRGGTWSVAWGAVLVVLAVAVVLSLLLAVARRQGANDDTV